MEITEVMHLELKQSSLSEFREKLMGAAVITSGPKDWRDCFGHTRP